MSDEPLHNLFTFYLMPNDPINMNVRIIRASTVIRVC